MIKKYTISIFVVFGFIANISAQRPGGAPFGNSQGFQTNPVRDTSNLFEQPDTFIYTYISALNKDAVIRYSDTSLQNFHRYDPARLGWAEHGSLGNAASAARPLLFQQSHYTGFNTGFEQYQLYQYTLDSFRFYNINRPISDLFFSPVGGQQNFIVKADFAAPFANGWTANVNFQRFNQVGFYSGQANKTTNFGFGLQYINPDKGREMFILFLSNVNQENLNGGITTDSLFDAPFFNNRLNIPVRLMEAQTRHDVKSLTVINYFSLLRASKSRKNGEETVPLAVMHSINYESGYYKFTDRDVTSDTDFYKNFVFDPRGIRYILRTDKISNTLLLDVSGGIIKDLKAGIVHDFIIVDDESSRGIRNDITLTANGTINIFKNLVMRTKAVLGIGSNAGAFDINGHIDYNIKNWATLAGGIKFFRSEPGLLFRSLVLNQRSVYSNELIKPFGSELSLSMFVKKTKTGISVRQNLTTNFLYWDENAMPAQTPGVFDASMLELRQDFRIWSFYFENYLFLQRFSDNVLGLPARYSRHNFYLNRKLFNKVLDLRIGAEATVMPEFSSNQFFPIMGVFYADQQIIPVRPIVDGYITGKISRFRFFIRLENISDFFTRSPAYFTPMYPVFDYRLRLGIRWQLLD